MAISLQPLNQWNRKIKSIRVRDENLILAIPPRYRCLDSGESVEIPIVDYYQKPLLIEGWLKHHRQRKLKPKIRVFGGNLDHVLQLVHKGVGCAVMPKHVIEADLVSGALLEHTLDKRRPWMVSVWLNSTSQPDLFSPSARCVWQKMSGRA